MFPKPPSPEPPRKAVAMQVVQQRVRGAMDTTTLVVPAAAHPTPPHQRQSEAAESGELP